MISQEIQPDDVDLFVRIQAAVDVVNAVKVLKGVTASRRFHRFFERKKRLSGGKL